MNSPNRLTTFLNVLRYNLLNQIPSEIEETVSPQNPARVNVVCEADSFTACQGLIFSVMERELEATFTIPVRSDRGSFLALGHYPNREHLPEL